jgi:hypothetical protein
MEPHRKNLWGFFMNNSFLFLFSIYNGDAYTKNIFLTEK